MSHGISGAQGMASGGSPIRGGGAGSTVVSGVAGGAISGSMPYRAQQPELATGVRARIVQTLLQSDSVILLLTLALVAFSNVMVYSTTGIFAMERYQDALFFVKRQVAASIIGLVAMLIVAQIRPAMLRAASPFMLPLCLLLLLLPLIPGLGDRAGGAQRWLNLGVVRFQPSELVKILFVLFVAGYLARHETRLRSFGFGVLKPLLLVGPIAFLLLVQPDFGSTAVIVIVTMVMAAVSGVRLRYMACGLLAVAALFALLVVISPYRMQRVMTFLSPWQDASGSGYQLIQSLIAVGTGQLTGVGLGASQQKLFFLPAAHTDFIFAVVGEELGLVGCSLILLAFLVFFARGVRLAMRSADDTFMFSLTVGLTLLIVAPALINMGVVTGLLPTKGMVLPLVGYGGSALITCLITVGLLLGIARSQRSS